MIGLFKNVHPSREFFIFIFFIYSRFLLLSDLGHNGESFYLIVNLSVSRRLVLFCFWFFFFTFSHKILIFVSMCFGKLPVGENYKTIAPLDELPARVYTIIRDALIYRIRYSRINASMQSANI